MAEKEEEIQATEQEVKDESLDNNKEETPIEEELSEVEVAQKEAAEFKDKYIRLYSEFENFRRRTAKEKVELMTNANERLILDLLPVLDDFERGEKALAESDDIKAVKEGVELVINKFKKILGDKGLKAVEATGEVFDVDLHEAITQIPSPSDDMKGKVIDETEKGYYLGEKIIRFSKVVVGA